MVKNFDQKIEKRGDKYNKPRVFTEQGITKLDSILKSELAIKMSLRIVDTFIAMRKYININLNNTHLLQTKY